MLLMITHTMIAGNWSVPRRLSCATCRQDRRLVLPFRRSTRQSLPTLKEAPAWLAAEATSNHFGAQWDGHGTGRERRNCVRTHRAPKRNH